VRGEAGATEETRADPKRVSEEEVAAIGVARPPLRGTLTVIDGQVYDIAPFLDKHPGGADLILLAAGRDATVMFHSYHRCVG
jgi:cytochrome b involved in lipid metabolism